MRHIHDITTDALKEILTPERYYSTFLNGSFGKHTGNGWHQWNGLCPFHDDRRAGSLCVNKNTGAFKCFSCGEAGGDIIALYMKKERLPFKEAFKALKEVASCAQ